MYFNQIFSYFEGTSQPAHSPDIQRSSPEFLELLQSLKCGDTLISIFPSVVYLIGIALLIHHIITMNIRPQLYRRVGRELLLQIPWQEGNIWEQLIRIILLYLSATYTYLIFQIANIWQIAVYCNKLRVLCYLASVILRVDSLFTEILIFMLIYQCIRIWLSTLVLLNTVFKYYQKQLNLICPWGMKNVEQSTFDLNSFPMISKGIRDFAKIPLIVFYIVTGIAPCNKFTNVSDIRNLHPLAQAVLAPRILKIIVCTIMSFIPFLALIKLKERRPLPQFMLWCIDCRMGPMRRDRSELGASGYYLERPIMGLSVNSTESTIKRSSSCNDVGQLKFRRRTRSRKSVSV